MKKQFLIKIELETMLSWNGDLPNITQNEDKKYGYFHFNTTENFYFVGESKLGACVFFKKGAQDLLLESKINGQLEEIEKNITTIKIPRKFEKEIYESVTN